MLALTIERERLEPLGGRPRRHRRTRRKGRPICLNWNWPGSCARFALRPSATWWSRWMSRWRSRRLWVLPGTLNQLLILIEPVAP